MLTFPTEKRFDWKYPPVMLFTLVLVNVLVFFFYQSSDDERFGQAVDRYLMWELLEKEWPAYQTFLTQEGETQALEYATELYSAGEHYALSAWMVGSEPFYQFLEADSDALAFDAYDISDTWRNWLDKREQVNAIAGSLSALQWGLIPKEVAADIAPIKFFSYQFLHGDFTHLLGNMLFLVFCGFAVEAAIGPALFLLLYLIAGAAGGALFSLLELESTRSLVGASASISGVMAMYLGVFRLRKVEFFYWIFVFAGYFRAPALLILPFYIGKEVLDYLYNPASNVAFMAHAGGFAAGASLLALVYALKPSAVNQKYVEEDQSIDPKQDALANIYVLVDQVKFSSALASIGRYEAAFGNDFDLALLRLQLSKAQGYESTGASLASLLALRPRGDQQLDRLAEVWAEHSELHALISEQQQFKLAMNLTNERHLKSAEDIFSRLQVNQHHHAMLGALARKLSLTHKRLNNLEAMQRYERFANAQLGGAI